MLTRSRSNKTTPTPPPSRGKLRGGDALRSSKQSKKVRDRGPAGLRVNSPASWFLHASRSTARGEDDVATLPAQLLLWMNEALENESHREALLSQYATRLLRLRPQLEVVWKFLLEAVQRFNQYNGTNKIIVSVDWLRTILELGAEVRRDRHEAPQGDYAVRSLSPLLRALAGIVPRETLCPLAVASMQQELAREDTCNSAWISSLTSQLLRSIVLDTSHASDARFLLLLLQLNASASHRAPASIRDNDLLEYFWTLYENDEICIESSEIHGLAWDATSLLNHTDLHDLFRTTWNASNACAPWGTRANLLLHLFGSLTDECDECRRIASECGMQRITRPIQCYLQGIINIATHTSPTTCEEEGDLEFNASDLDVQRTQCPYLTDGVLRTETYTFCCAKHATFRHLTLYCEDVVAFDVLPNGVIADLLESDLNELLTLAETASNILLQQSHVIRRFQLKKSTNNNLINRHMWNVVELVCQVFWTLLPMRPTCNKLTENLWRVTMLQKTCISTLVTHHRSTRGQHLLTMLTRAYPAPYNKHIREFQGTIASALGVECIRSLILQGSSLFSYELQETDDSEEGELVLRTRRQYACFDMLKYMHYRNIGPHFVEAMRQRTLMISFVGEPGVGTGVVREWLKLVGEQLIGLMSRGKRCIQKRGLWALVPSTTTRPSTALTRQLELLGYVLAGCMAFRMPFPVPLAPSFIFAVLRVEWPSESDCDIKDLIRTTSIEIDPETVAGVAKMLDMDAVALESMGLDAHDLAPAMYTEPHPLTHDICNTVVRHVLHARLGISDASDERLNVVAKSIRSILHHDSEVLALMGPWQLFRFINGESRTPTLAEWRGKVYRNMNVSSDQWSIFWLAMADLSDQERTHLFTFITNLPVPCLDQPIATWWDSTIAQDAFPQAQTCFRQFNVPLFTDVETCLRRLREVCALQVAHDADRMRVSNFQFA